MPKPAPLVVETADLRVVVPTPFPVGAAFDEALRLAYAPRPLQDFMKERGIVAAPAIDSASNHVSLWTVSNHTRFARTESIAAAHASTRAVLAALGKLRARLKAAPVAPSTATWSEEDARALSQAIARSARAEMRTFKATAGWFPIPYWLPPPAEIFALTDRAKKSAASGSGLVVDPNGRVRVVPCEL